MKMVNDLSTFVFFATGYFLRELVGQILCTSQSNTLSIKVAK